MGRATKKAGFPSLGVAGCIYPAALALLKSADPTPRNASKGKKDKETNEQANPQQNVRNVQQQSMYSRVVVLAILAGATALRASQSLITNAKSHESFEETTMNL